MIHSKEPRAYRMQVENVHLWNIRFNQTIKSFGFEQNLDEPCVYKRH